MKVYNVIGMLIIIAFVVLGVFNAIAGDDLWKLDFIMAMLTGILLDLRN